MKINGIPTVTAASQLSGSQSSLGLVVAVPHVCTACGSSNFPLVAWPPAQEKSSEMTFDWEKAHRQLASLQATLDRGWLPDAAETQNILASRAAMLGGAADAPDLQEGEGAYLEFAVGRYRYAIDAFHVGEVVTAAAVTKVPGTPAFVVGIINLHGQPVSVVNLPVFFGFNDPDTPAFHRIVLLRANLAKNEMLVGVLASSTTGVRFFHPALIQASLNSPTAPQGAFVQGVTVDAVVILDAEKLLFSEMMLVNADAHS